MDKKIITLEELQQDDQYKLIMFNDAEKCNLDVRKVYDKMRQLLEDYSDVDYINRRLPTMMNYFIFGYLMCYNAHVRFNGCKPYFEK